MFKSIKIQNFESWVNCFIKFDEGVNVIIGHSDNGKSGLLRALKWPITNRPLGESFISWLESENKGTGSLLTLNNNIFISRFKNETSNTYELSSFDNLFKAFGTNVPDEIEKELNIDPLLNIQNQTDPHFLLASSPGEVAKILNKVSNLDIINLTLSNGKEDVRKTKIKKCNIEESLAQKQKEILNYNYLENFKILLDKALEKEKEIRTLNERYQIINELITRADRLEKRIKTKSEKYKLIDLVNKTLSINELKKLNEKKYSALNKKLKNIAELKIKLRNNEKKYKLFEVVNDNIIMNINIQKLKKKVNKISDKLNNINNLSKKIENNTEKLVKLKKQFNKHMPDICPLCGRS